MLTQTRQTKAATIERTIRVNVSDYFDAVTVFAVVTEKTVSKFTSDVYTLERRPSDYGLYVRVEQQGSNSRGGSYDVLLNAPGGGHDCTCPHGTYKGHVKPCRHVEAALQAIRERKL